MIGLLILIILVYLSVRIIEQTQTIFLKLSKSLVFIYLRIHASDQASVKTTFSSFFSKEKTTKTPLTDIITTLQKLTLKKAWILENQFSIQPFLVIIKKDNKKYFDIPVFNN